MEVHELVSEFAVRREFARLVLAPDEPARKGRALLRLARRVKRAALDLVRLAVNQFHAGDFARSHRFREAASKLVALYDEIRASARDAYRISRARFGFGYGKTAAAYPRWQIAEVNA